jgi:hypothetical protein
MDAKTTQRIKDGMAYELGRKGPPKNFPPLPSVPASRYTEKDFYDLEFGFMLHTWINYRKKVVIYFGKN